MTNRKTTIALTLTALISLFAADCGSASGSPSASSATVTASSATTTSTSTLAKPPPAPSPWHAAGGLASDCKILKPIGANALGRLIPLQTLPPAQAQATRAAYLSELRSAQASLTSPQGESDLGAFISALQGASSMSAGQAILGDINKIQADCP